MIVTDANLLLYAHDTTSTHHIAANRWLSKVLSESVVVGLPWQAVWAFLRISTNSRIMAMPLTMEQATTLAGEWMQLRHVQLLAPAGRHWQLLKEMLLTGQVRGPQTTDAELAALTIEYGGVLHTTDRGFARFPGLRWTNPLSGS